MMFFFKRLDAKPSHIHLLGDHFAHCYAMPYFYSTFTAEYING